MRRRRKDVPMANEALRSGAYGLFHKINGKNPRTARGDVWIPNSGRRQNLPRSEVIRDPSVIQHRFDNELPVTESQIEGAMFELKSIDPPEERPPQILIHPLRDRGWTSPAVENAMTDRMRRALRLHEGTEILPRRRIETRR